MLARIAKSGFQSWLLLTACATAFAAPGDWPEVRQNGYLTGIQPLTGRMKQPPVLLAQMGFDRTQPNLQAVSLPARKESVGLALVDGGLQCYNTSGRLRWKCHPAGINFVEIVATEDLDGGGGVEVALKAGRPADPYGAAVLVRLSDGRVLWRYDVEPMSYWWTLRVGNYLPATKAKQLIVLMHGYPPDKDNGYIALFEFPEKGKPPVQKWRYNFDKYTCFPTLLQTDLDGDGVKELVVETHSRMWFFDPVTGKVKYFVGWDTSPANIRSYGLVRFLDLDGDGREDFLCLANFAQHHEVLLNKNGKMQLAWCHGWPESVTTKKVATTWPEPPQADADGDRKLEIVLSMFNSEEEGAWLIRIYDAVTGKLKYRIPGMIAVATADIDRDGQSEILANLSTDPTGVKTGGARVLRIQGHGSGERSEVLWQDDRGRAMAPATGAAFRFTRGGATFALEAAQDGKLVEKPWHAPAGPAKPVFLGLPRVQGPNVLPKLLAVDLHGTGRNELWARARKGPWFRACTGPRPSSSLVSFKNAHIWSVSFPVYFLRPLCWVIILLPSYFVRPSNGSLPRFGTGVSTPSMTTVQTSGFPREHPQATVTFDRLMHLDDATVIRGAPYRTNPIAFD